MMSAEPPPLLVVSVVEDERGVSKTQWWQLPVLGAGRCGGNVNVSLTDEKKQ